MTDSLQQLAMDALGRNPAWPAIEFEGEWLGWGDLRSLSDDIARLLGESGIRKDAPVAFIPRNRPSAIAALLSFLAHARNVQMIYGFQSPAGIARDIDRLKPAALIGGVEDLTEDVLAPLRAQGIATIGLDGMRASAVPGLEKATSAAADRAGPEKRQIEVFTSGTTGPPKQFAIAHDILARHHMRENRLPFLNEEESRRTPPFLLYYPVGNISGLYSIVPPILKGQRTILLDRFSIEAWRDYVVKHRPPNSGIPTSFFQVLLDADVPQEDLASLKVMGAGAAPLDPEVQRAFEDKYGIPIVVSYGATEFGGPVTALTLDDHARFGRAKLGTVGRPIAGAKLRVVDPETGGELPPGEEGLLEVVSPRIGPDWIRTADIGVIDGDGFVFHRGRADGAIVRGGFKILPETIETALKLHPAISQAVVVGIADKRLGQVPAAAIILRPGETGVDQAMLEQHLREHVMKTHIPVRWMFVEDYPRTVSAKIDRPAIARLFAEAAE